MMRLFAILALCLLVGSSGQAQSTKDEIHMRATVRDVAPLAEFSGRVIAVDGDPRFALTVRIESVDPADGNFAVGTDVVFAIHSPAMLFATGPTIGSPHHARGIQDEAAEIYRRAGRGAACPSGPCASAP